MKPGARHYAIVTAAYWGFTLTDGALRMLVLLHFFHLGYSPFVLSFLFLLYEAAGIAANFIGGWLATRFGITRMLTVGLTTQITGFLVLSALSPDWDVALSVTWVVAAQGICGVAKDLTKTASKSAIKVAEKEARAEDAEGRLFRWVAWFTGSKNAMKGFGFFLGGVLLQMLGFRLPLWVMAAEDVGFYYAANAAGRFSGTLLSGLLYQWGGITACPAGSALMLAACFLTTLALPLRRYS